MSMGRVFSCVVGRGCLLWPVCSLGKTVSFCPASFCTPKPNLPVTPGIFLSTPYFCMGKSNSDDHYIYYCGQGSLRINGVALIVNKRVQNAVLGCNLKNDRMISVCFQGKPFYITVIKVYAPTTNAKEAEVEQFYDDVQDLLEIAPKKKCPFHHRGLECKSRKSRDKAKQMKIKVLTSQG